ncbi:hypothetical protein KAU11_11430 [Candidatus Babeliales bacterium]|nr:hypothetical protein [Candidatus Babeliales bacterium]
MRTKKEIEEKLSAILADERLEYPTATIDTNAPLALIQLSLEMKKAALEWVLEKKEKLYIG